MMLCSSELDMELDSSTDCIGLNWIGLGHVIRIFMLSS